MTELKVVITAIYHGFEKFIIEVIYFLPILQRHSLPMHVINGISKYPPPTGLTNCFISATNH